MSEHKFHIPVMGIGFTVDSPAKIAHYGISSVISLVDDILLEKMRKFYSETFSLSYNQIEKSDDDFRARRITAYLNTIQDVVDIKIEKLKKSLFEAGSEITKYFEMLQDENSLKSLYHDMINCTDLPKKEALQDTLRSKVVAGSIDVNIMTKLDRTVYAKGEALPIEYNDAHAALRGFAKSKSNGSIVLSAGMNSKLFSYMAKLPEFKPDDNGVFRKKIILKVSDHRSAVTQGKFLAKKGLWVSEFRIESGLNCGGHAFATQGYLMGPILSEFQKEKETLEETIFKVYQKALAKSEIAVSDIPEMIITAQGGVGTADEQNMLLNNYDLKSIGWGSPFLLTPEVSNVDEFTFNLLKNAGEKDLYLSGISPLGVPFNNVRGNSKDVEKQSWVDNGTPGSICPKMYLVSNKEFSKQEVCTASRFYQKRKLIELNDSGITGKEFDDRYNKIIEKACICVGLGTPALLINDLDRKLEGNSVSVCPGPNIAYFTEKTTLQEMSDHIYNRSNVNVDDNRPHLFSKELSMYVDHLKDTIKSMAQPLSDKDIKFVSLFKDNLLDGISYYRDLVSNKKLSKFESVNIKFLDDLSVYEFEIDKTMMAII